MECECYAMLHSNALFRRSAQHLIDPQNVISVMEHFPFHSGAGERGRERTGERERVWLIELVSMCVYLPSTDLIVFHLESLTDLRKELKRLPVAKVSHAPPLITLRSARSSPLVLMVQYPTKYIHISV